MTRPSEPVPEGGTPPAIVDPAALSHRDRYRLLSSLIIPRPIGWLSTRSASGLANLAPYSYFNAVSASPPLLAVSINLRRGVPKDSLANIRETGAFCVNVVSGGLLEAMNASSADVAPEVDEFELTGLTAIDGRVVDAPVVKEARAALECLLFKEVDLGEAPSTLVIGEVKAIHLSPVLRLEEGSWAVDPESLAPVGRLGTDAYTLLGEIRRLSRP
jgi:flavin reductase (DIM6/NTAB) family NADH-FMN oxidoreductase RutF